MFARSASFTTDSGKERPSYSIRNWKTLPPLPQPKHLKMPLSGVTKKEGVFSLWKGQQALKFLPFLVKAMRSPITSWMGLALLTFSRYSWEKEGIA